MRDRSIRGWLILPTLAIIGSIGTAAEPLQQPPQTLGNSSAPPILEGRPLATRDTASEGAASEFVILFGQKFKITDLLLIMFTGGLFIATVALWWATRSLVVNAADTSKRQLRAYISATPFTMQHIGPNENLWIRFNAVNHGHTPAYSCTQSGDMFFLDHPLQENFTFPKLPSEHLSKLTLHSNLLFQGDVLATKKFTQAQWIEAFQAPAIGGKRLYFFGQIDYVDAFRAKHLTRVCFSFKGFHDMMPLARDGNWNEINKIFSQTNLSLGFELASQHNVTDDG
jgi:hypothetical protein